MLNRGMKKVPEELYGIRISELARICKVSIKTATRWKRGQSVPPETALMVLTGDLGIFSKDWRRWCVRGDALVSPEGWVITSNDVRAAPLLRAQLAVYQAENRQLRKLDLDIEEQPSPDQWIDLRNIG